VQYHACVLKNRKICILEKIERREEPLIVFVKAINSDFLIFFRLTTESKCGVTKQECLTEWFMEKDRVRASRFVLW